MGEIATHNPFDKLNNTLSLIQDQLAEITKAIGAEAVKEKRYYPIKEAAEKLGVSPITLYRNTANGKIPSKKIGQRVLIPGSYVDR